LGFVEPVAKKARENSELKVKLISTTADLSRSSSILPPSLPPSLQISTLPSALSLRQPCRSPRLSQRVKTRIQLFLPVRSPNLSHSSLCSAECGLNPFPLPLFLCSSLTLPPAHQEPDPSKENSTHSQTSPFTTTQTPSSLLVCLPNSSALINPALSVDAPTPLDFKLGIPVFPEVSCFASRLIGEECW